MKKKQVMESRELKINVASTLIRLRNQNFKLQSALLELIDNSIDAGAKNVKIRQVEDSLLIEDDGSGFDDIFLAFDIGESRKVGQIGRYGVGLKDASVKYSTKTTISSKGMSASCDWNAAIESGKAEVVQCQCSSDLTVVRWEGFESRHKHAILTQEIRRCYAIALGRDLSIEVNGEKLLPTPEPSFTETINETFNYADKRVRLSGGVFRPSDENRKSWAGYNIYYQGRLIGDGRIMDMGMGDVSCSNFSFKLELDDDDERWVLATNKDSVEGASELLDYIFHTYTRTMLKSAELHAIDIELRDVISAVESACSATGNITRKPRTNADTRGQTKRQGRPKMNTFSPDSDGGYSAEHSSKGAQGGIRLLFVDLESETLGEVSTQSRLLVSLNKSNKFIADNISNIPVMSAVAVIIYAMHMSGGALLKDFEINAALQIAGQNLSRQKED